MPPEVKKQFHKKVIYGIIAYVAVFLALILIAYSKPLSDFLVGVLNLFRPILLGLVIAYLCNPFFRFFERRLFLRLRPAALRRALALICTYLTALAILAGLILLLLPQLAESILSFSSHYQEYVDQVVDNINGIFAAINGTMEKLIGKGNFFAPITDTQFFDSIRDFFFDEKNGVLSQISTETITGAAGAFVGLLTDIIFAVFISIYLLASKEKRYAQVMKLRHALFNDQTNQRITKLCTTADNLFGKFLEGKLVDSIIIGLLLYLFLSLFGIPYALLIAAFSAIMSIIPIMGYLVGVIPAALFVFMTDAEKLLPYLIIVFVIYQLDVNIISPKLLGSNTGVSSLCVIVSICIMGNLFGFVGMVIAVPLAATLLDLIDSIAHLILQRKRLPDDVENYYAPDPIADPVRGISMGRGKLIKKLEKKVLHARSLKENGMEDQLRASDRFVMLLYSVSRKHRLLGETPHEILTQFSAEEATRQIRMNAEHTRADFALQIPEDARVPHTSAQASEDETGEEANA